MTHEHRAAQIEGFEHAADIVGEVVDRMAGVADGGLAVAASVEREGAEARGRESSRTASPTCATTA